MLKLRSLALALFVVVSLGPGVAFPLRFGHWKGARVGVFCYGRDGHVDVDYVRYDYSNQPGRDTVAR